MLSLGELIESKPGCRHLLYLDTSRLVLLAVLSPLQVVALGAATKQVVSNGYDGKSQCHEYRQQIRVFVHLPGGELWHELRHGDVVLPALLVVHQKLYH